MRKWVCTIERFNSEKTSTAHIIMRFSFAEKVGHKLYDTYIKQFELSFQANTSGKYSNGAFQNALGESEWYAPIFKNIELRNAELAIKAIRKINRFNIKSPKDALKALNALTVMHVNGRYHYINEVYDDVSLLRSPLEEVKLKNIS